MHHPASPRSPISFPRDLKQRNKNESISIMGYVERIFLSDEPSVGSLTDLWFSIKVKLNSMKAHGLRFLALSLSFSQAESLYDFLCFLFLLAYHLS